MIDFGIDGSVSWHYDSLGSKVIRVRSGADLTLTKLSKFAAVLTFSGSFKPKNGSFMVIATSTPLTSNIVHSSVLNITYAAASASDVLFTIDVVSAITGTIFEGSCTVSFMVYDLGF